MAAAGLVIGGILAASPALAAPGDAFNPADPLVFVAQDNPTQLYQAITNAQGTVEFSEEGAPAAISYNAISYNQADNYLYGVTAVSTVPGIPVGSLVRIGQDGVVTRVGTGSLGTSQNIGGFGGDGLLYTTGSGSLTANVWNTSTGTIARTVTLSQTTNVSDWTFAEGFLWGISDGPTSGPLVVRTDPTTGAVRKFPAPAGVTAESAFGAAWTFGNGNLGFSANSTGTVYQITVANPAGTPTFRVVAKSDGPSSSANDGAASSGLPTDLAVVKTAPAVLPSAGGPITYTITVTNNGPGNSSGFVIDDVVPAPLTNVATTDDGCTVTGNALRCVGGALQNGASVSYTVTANVPAGVDTAIENTVTVAPNEEDPTPGNNTSTATSGPAGISLVKNAGTPVDVNGNGLVDEGDTIQFTFDVTNTGLVSLTGISVADPLAGTVACPEPDLAAGASQTCAAESVYTITAEDVANGSVDNTATASGNLPDGSPLTSEPSSTSTPTAEDAPGITIVKSADPSDAASYQAGQEVTYNFVVTNTGNVPLSDVGVVEGDFSGTGDLSDVVCPADTLAVGEQLACTATYTLTQDDVDAGELTNTATAEGTPPGGTPVPSDPSTVSIPSVPAPALTIVKSASVQEITEAGEDITYSFVVTNTGNVTLGDVVVNETEFSGSGELGDIVCPADTLLPGQATTCTADYTVTQTDVDAGQLTNAATADGTPPGGSAVTSDPSDVTVPVDQAPALTIVKSASVQEIAEAGEEITYTFLITNSGNVTVTDPAVVEGEFSGTGELSAIECEAGDSLAPGDDITCTATYVVTQADVDAGELTNTATAEGTTPGGGSVTSDPSDVEVPVDQAPELTLLKTSDATVVEVGQTVTYSFLITNSGNVTITDPTVTEGDFSGTGELSEIVCPADVSLAPGDDVTCTATYVVTQADFDAGALTNAATTTGTTPGGDPTEPSVPSTVTVPSAPAPSLTIAKSASTQEITEAGEEITYSFLVTNTGNVDLDDIVVNETEFSGSGELSEIVCPDGDGLAPGEDVTCTATYVVTQADVDAGEITNAATAEGTPPGGDPVTSSPSTVTVPVDQAPALTLLKTSDAVAAQAGQTVTYSFLITNSGNVTIADPTVAEGEFSGTGELSAIECPADVSLAPGEDVTCTATYVVTQADVDAGELTNVATTTGTTPGGDPTEPSDPSENVVTTDPLAALAIVKTADVEKVTAAGQTVTYSFEVSNVGNITLSDPAVVEGEFTGNGELSEVVCPEGDLGPGASFTCTATYTVVAADLADGGTLSNTATASATTPGGDPITSDPSTADVDEIAPADGGLAVTGGAIAWSVAGLAVLLLVAGGVLMIARRREHVTDEA